MLFYIDRHFFRADNLNCYFNYLRVRNTLTIKFSDYSRIHPYQRENDQFGGMSDHNFVQTKML